MTTFIEETMIGRIAKVIADNAENESSADDVARLVLEEMRETTDLMGLGLRDLPGGYKAGSHSAADIWRAMIDAALKEKID